MNQEIIKKIEELFTEWCDITAFDSTGTWGYKEKKNLLDFCSEYIEEFKEFAKNTLSRPQECCYKVANLCYELLPTEIPSKNIENFLKCIKYREFHIFQPCNEWLNYFNGTDGVDYYGDYIRYKEYLQFHYISWNPYKEKDPNPSYEEFVNNRDRYKI